LILEKMPIEDSKEEDINNYDKSSDQDSSNNSMIDAEMQKLSNILMQDFQPHHQNMIILTSNDDRKKHVSFGSKIPTIIETLHYTDYTEEEKLRCWYCRFDLIQMKRDFYIGIKKKPKRKKGSNWIEEQKENYNHIQSLETRNLENNTSERIEQRRFLRTKAWRAVLQEQEMQMHYGHANVGAIADRYILVSKQCAFEAYNTGLEYEVEAFRNDNDDEKENNNSNHHHNIRMGNKNKPLLPRHLKAKTKRKLLDIVESWKNSTNDEQQKGGRNNHSLLRSSITTILSCHV